MFDFEEKTLNKIWENPEIDVSSFKYAAKETFKDNLTESAEFIANDMVMNAWKRVLESCSISGNIGAPENINSSSLKDFGMKVLYTSEVFKKIEEVAAMLAAYNEWKDEVDVY